MNPISNITLVLPDLLDSSNIQPNDLLVNSQSNLVWSLIKESNQI